MKSHEGYFTTDGTGDNGWARCFIASMPDKSVGVLIAEDLDRDPGGPFDFRKEMNLAILCAGSWQHALRMMNSHEREAPPNPPAMRRLARLLQNGSLVEHLKDTMAERGAERLVVYGKKMNHDSYSIFDRAGFRKETRGEIECRVLDLDL